MIQEREHAMLAPSSSSRWSLCPASAKLEYEYADTNLGNPASRTGQLAHKYAELIFKEAINSDLKGDLTKILKGRVEKSEEFKIIRKSKDWIEDIPPIIFEKYCKPIWNECIVKNPGGIMRIEEIVSCSPLIENCWGTADLVYINSNLLRIIDLKFGLIPVKEISQQLLYAFGAYIKYYGAYNIEKVEMRIVQPRLTTDPIYSVTITAADLLHKINDEWVDIGQRANVGGEFHASDVACKYCKASYKCDAFRRFYSKVMDATKGVVLDPTVEVAVKQEWLDYIAGIPSLENYIKVMKVKIAELLRSGAKVPGWVLKQRNTREWRLSVQEIAEKLRERGATDDQIFEKKLRTVAGFDTVTNKTIKSDDLFTWKQSVGTPSYVGGTAPIDLNSLGSGK